MNIVSIHSHKGGAGKTTLTLILAKVHARARRKVCAVDLDFVGSGFQHLFDIPAPARYLDEYLVRDPDALDLPALEDMIAHYAGEDLHGGQIDLVYNLGGERPAAGRSGERQAYDHRRAEALAGEEPGLGVAGSAVERLLSQLEEAQYDLVLLDCHPGLAYLSKSVLRLASRRGDSSHLTVFMTTANRSHFHGLLNELNYLGSEEGERLFAPSRSILCVNRGPSCLGPSWDDMATEACRSPVHRDQATARVATFKEVWGQQGLSNYVRIRESAALTQSASVSGDGEIRLPDEADIARTDTDVCRRVLLSLGR